MATVQAPEEIERSYSFDFDSDESETVTVDATADAAKANAVSESVLKSISKKPEIAELPDTVVSLPGGLHRDGAVLRSAEVRELTGADEEALAKVRLHPGRFVSALLKCGVVEIGGYPATASLLRELLIGDRDTLVLAVSRATFGNDIEYKNITCPHCLEVVDMTIHLDEIPTATLDDDAEREFDVSLRRGRSARVRLPDGNDQEKLFDSFDLSGAEQNTILLSRCILSITEANGSTKKVTNGKTLVMAMGVSDRHAILEALAEKAIGPQYDKVSFHHETCDKDVAVEVSVGDLFRGL